MRSRGGVLSNQSVLTHLGMGKRDPPAGLSLWLSVHWRSRRVLPADAHERGERDHQAACPGDLAMGSGGSQQFAC